MRVIGIDPGSSLLGVACLTLDNTGKIIDVDAHTLDFNHIYRASHWLRDDTLIEGALDRVRVINKVLMKYIKQCQPVLIGIETPFLLNKLHVQSYASLRAQLAITLRDIQLTVPPSVGITQIPPGVVKKEIGVTGSHKDNKIATMYSILDKEELAIPLTKKNEILGPDAYDAIAVAYAALRISQ